jgi:hypothetical protein
MALDLHRNLVARFASSSCILLLHLVLRLALGIESCSSLALILRLTLCLAVIFHFTSLCCIRSPASCLLVAIPQLAITSSLLTYLRTIHYFIHLNSSSAFLILLLSSHLALAFCSFISLPCAVITQLAITFTLIA